jgi:PAS domain S-box-containing protein
VSVESLLRGLLVLVGIVVVGGVALWYVNNDTLAGSRAQVLRTRAIQAELMHVKEAVLEIEVAVRGYALSNDPAELAAVDRHTAEARAAQTKLGELTADMPAQRDRVAALDRVLDTELEAVSRAVEQARANPAAAPDASLGARNAALAELAALHDAMSAEEQTMYEARRRTALRSTSRMSWLGAVALIVLIAFTAVMYVLIRRQLGNQRVAAEQINRSEKFLSAVVENIPAMVFVKEAGELRFERFNRAGEQLLGVSRTDLLGKNDHDMFPREQAEFFIAKDRETLSGKEILDIPEEPIETSGGKRWLHTRKVPILDDDGRPAYLLGISEDITSQKQRMEALREARDATEAANRELEAFAYSVAHDLRAPLRAIDGFSHAVLEDHRAQLPAEAIDFLGRVRTASHRMGEVIDALLELSRLTRVDIQRERIDLSAKARGLLDELAKAHPDRKVELVIEPGLTAYGDLRLLRQALGNLLSNAWKYTQHVTAARIEVGRQKTGERAFFVRDNGAGFDMAHKDKLFAPFQRLHAQREFEGHGIGLVTAARVIQRHGGRIWADAAVGQGATFYFVIPEVSV